MYGDYSRGHEPDRKRGRNYRRVLLQMGRPVLDSDVASMVDALLGEVRATTRGLELRRREPRPRLPRHARPPAGRLRRGGGRPDRDAGHARRLDRLPLPLRRAVPGPVPGGHGRAGAGHAAAPAAARPGRRPDPRGALGPRRGRRRRSRSTASPSASHPSPPTRLSASSSRRGPRRSIRSRSRSRPATRSGCSCSSRTRWRATSRPSGSRPAATTSTGSSPTPRAAVRSRPSRFPTRPASRGARARSRGRRWTGCSPPAAWRRRTRSSPTSSPGSATSRPSRIPASARRRWARRTRPRARSCVGQVKLATLTGVLPAGAAAAGAMRAAFDAVEVSGGLLTIDVPDTTPTTDPCALPDLAGYSGSDNRLYRVEVHRGGGLSQVRLKWSRDNGSELFDARLDASQNLVFDPGTPLAAGDIVEVLSNVVDLGDDALAQVQRRRLRARPARGRPARAARGGRGLVLVRRGRLPPRRARQRREPGVARRALRDAAGRRPQAAPLARDPRSEAARGRRLRLARAVRARGRDQASSCRAPAPTVPASGGSTRRASTARTRTGRGGPTPHGPERRFAPLALLEYRRPPASRCGSSPGSTSASRTRATSTPTTSPSPAAASAARATRSRRRSRSSSSGPTAAGPAPSPSPPATISPRRWPSCPPRAASSASRPGRTRCTGRSS